MSDFEMNIGLEVHVQLQTKTKIFSRMPTHFGQEANTQVSALCLGMPGTLPILNYEVLGLAIRAGLVLNCAIAPFTKFDRKNYFYPDLPKGYQISQYDLPICHDGFVSIQTEHGEKTIKIVRAHLEEDAGKMIHGENNDPHSYVDLNRAGVPLLEIVSAPDMISPEEAYLYMKEIKSIMEYMGVSDCNMQEGSLRCDANISLRPKGQQELGTKTEIKNINSFNFVRKALIYEAKRQEELLRENKSIEQATYTWDEVNEVTKQMRGKEDAHDYRYFPDPDLPPIRISQQTIDSVRQELPELPRLRQKRFEQQYQLSEKDAENLIENRAYADYFEQCVSLFNQPQEIMNWLKGQVRSHLNDTNSTIENFSLTPQQLVELLQLINQKTISHNAAKEVFQQMIKTGKTAKDLAKGKQKITDEQQISEWCKEAMSELPNLAEDYQKNPQALNAILGKVMKKSSGRADAQIVRKKLQELLTN